MSGTSMLSAIVVEQPLLKRVADELGAAGRLHPSPT